MNILREQIQEIRNRISELKKLLHKTDYQAIKFAEGELTAAEYEETKMKRRAWRAEINELEAEIAELRKMNNVR